MNMKFLLYFFSQPVFAVHRDPFGLSSKRSHVPVFNRCSPHVIVRSEGAAKIQWLSGGGLNPNQDHTDEVGVKRTRNAWGSQVYTVCGDAVAPLWRVMRRLHGCRDRICPGIQPTPLHYLCVPPFPTMQGVFLCCRRVSGGMPSWWSSFLLSTYIHGGELLSEMCCHD